MNERPSLKDLEDSDLPRGYWRGHDGRDGIWLFESVEGDGEHWAIRQIEIDGQRRAHRYWWKHPEDEHGFLTDHALDTGSLIELTHDEFRGVWDALD